MSNRMQLLTLLLLPALCLITGATGFGIHHSVGPRQPSQMKATPSSVTTPSTRKIVDTSTLVLLEHVNINVPTHEYILPFYYELLGCGMDPRKAANLQPDAPKKTLWANCGASQFHLPYGDTAQVIPGHIGLAYESLDGLKGRLSAHEGCFRTAEMGSDESGREFVRLVDQYGNVFYCRQDTVLERRAREWKQPYIAPSNEDFPTDVVQRFGRESTDCRGIDYVEFQCPVGTADRISLFYDTLFDATTSVVDMGEKGKVAIVAFGNIDENGRADQSLIFRESSEPLPPYDGHHIAMYVGESAADFERAFANALTAGIVWANPRFSDKALDLAGARHWKQFRLKDIIDMETGEPLMQLEHEMRSVEHEAWPGRS